MPQELQDYKSYEHHLFRLSDQDFIDVGCTKEELEQVREWNERLKETDQKIERQENLTKEEKDTQRLYEEKLYLTFLNAADRNPRRWEYSRSKLPNWVQSTGNINIQNQILWTLGKQLPIADKVRLLKRRMATMKAKQIAKDMADEEKAKQYQERCTVKENDQGVFLEGIEQKEFQSSGNGCWSVSTQMLLQSRGIKDVTQTDIRGYRPDYESNEIRKIMTAKKPTAEEEKLGIGLMPEAIDQEAYEIMQSDYGNNVMERGDAFLNMAPNSMLQGIQISPYDEDIRRLGISRKEYLERTKQTVKDNIIHAIKEEKSPVSFLAGGHYITITGIDKKGNVTYKDSLNRGERVNADHKISLDKLLQRVVAPNASPIRMEWAADIKLSKDGQKLYGVPSEYLTVGEDGEVLMPDELENDANILKTYQYKTGHYVQRNHLSEGPDAEGNAERNLLNGGVKLSQITFMPKKLNMDALQKKAQERSLEEEEHLKQDSKDFYKVEYPENAPRETKESLNAKYNAINSEFRHQKEVMEKQGTSKLVEKAKTASANGNVPGGNGPYEQYFEELKTEAQARMAVEKPSEFKLKEVVSLGAAAAKLKADGVAFNKAKIQALAGKLRDTTKIGDLSVNESKEILTQPNQAAVFKGIQSEVLNGAYSVEPKYQEAYFKEIKQLAENMMSKEKRSDAYIRYYDAVQKASKIDPNAPDVSDQIAKANKEIFESVKNYMAGKEKVRTFRGGRERFNNAVDGLAILKVYAPKGCGDEAANIVNKINNLRGVSRTKADANRVDLMNYGGENAKRSKEERMKLENKKNKTV